MKTPRIVVSTFVGMLFCATASASLKVTFNETRTRATFAFDSSDRERKLFLAYGSSDCGLDLNDWELVRQVGVVPSGCTSLPDVVLPDDFAVSGRVARAFLNGVRLTSDDYIQKGLALQYDAIDNAGRGQHADAPTEWVDLVGGKNLPLVTEGAEADSASADYMYIGSTEHKTVPIFSAYCNMTMEGGFAVTAFHKAEKDTELYFRIPMLGAIGCDTRDDNKAFQFRVGGYVAWLNSDYANLAAFSASGNYAYCSLRCENFTEDASATSFAFIDGSGRLRSSILWVGIPDGLHLTVGNADGAAKVRSLRIYNRTLTDDEQRWNYAVDRARFEGDDTVASFETSQVAYAPIPLQVVRVWKAVPGVSPLAFDVEFTGADLNRRLCIGWARRDQGSVYSNWENRRELTTVSRGVTGLKVEIPDDVSALLDDSGYRLFLERTPASDDYVQKGLALQYDAIDNAGRGLHADAPTAWVDLVGGKNLPLVMEGAEADSASADYMYIGSTEHNAGSIFLERCDMTMEAGFAVTAFHKAGKDTELYFRIPQLGAICCDTRENNMAFQFRVGAYVSWMKSDYANLAAFSASGNYAYCSLRCGNFTTDTSATSFAFIDGSGRSRGGVDYWSGVEPEGLYLTVGNADGAAKVRSLRIYNRTLTDDEQRWNYAVDRARFECDFGEAVLFTEATSFARLKKGFAIIIR